MAELLGYLTSSWPTWLVGLMAVIILIVGGVFYFYWSAGYYDEFPTLRRKKHGKK